MSMKLKINFNPSTHRGGGSLRPGLSLKLVLTPLVSKLSTDTSWLFLNMPKDHIRPITKIANKIDFKRVPPLGPNIIYKGRGPVSYRWSEPLWVVGSKK